MRPRRQTLTRTALGVALALSATRAEAHLVTTGMGAVYDGIGHFFLSPGEVLPAVGLALLAGLRGAPAGRWVLLLLPLAWIGGGLGGLISGLPYFSSNMPAACALLLLGGLALVDCPMPAAVVGGLAILVGGTLGFLNGVAIGEVGVGPALLQLTGVGAILFVLVAIIAGCVVPLPQGWMRVGVRVAASWLAAIGLLLLGWSLRGGG